jgi:hypothetical protein
MYPVAAQLILYYYFLSAVLTKHYIILLAQTSSPLDIKFHYTKCIYLLGYNAIYFSRSPH